MIGAKLFGMIAKLKPALAEALANMMLEMDSAVLLAAMVSEQQLKAQC